MFGPLLDLIRNVKTMGIEYYDRFYSMYAGYVTRNSAVNDPQKQGRIKLKCYDLGRKQEVLQYAYPVSPFAGFNHGFFMTPELDEFVYVEFENGDCRYPRYSGGWWPYKNPSDDHETPSATDTTKPPVSYVPRVAQADGDESTFVFKDPFVSEDIKTGDKKSIADLKGTDVMNAALPNSWGSSPRINEPAIPYQTKYPMDKVIRTKRGLLFELDDTCDETCDKDQDKSDSDPSIRDGKKDCKPKTSKQRIHIWHPTGTFIEIHPDGKMVIRTRADRHVVIGAQRTPANDRLHIYGAWDVVVEDEVTIHGMKSGHLKFDKDFKLEVGGDLDIRVGGHYVTQVGAETVLRSGGAINNYSGSAIGEHAPSIGHDHGG